MFKLSLVTFLSFVLFQLTQAVSVTITSPKPNDVLKAGETVEIKWTIADNAQLDNVSIALASGPAQALVIDQIIAASADAKKGSYKWTIPQSVKPKTKYVIEIGPNSSDIAFAGYISIARPSKSQSSSAVPSASASASGHHPSASHSAAGNKHKPTATLPSSIAPKPTSKPKPSHSEESVKPKPTASASKKDDDKPKHDDKPKKEDDKPKKEDDNKKNDDKEHAKEEPRYICHAYPDENGEMTTKCGPAPSGISKPSKRGTLLRRLLLNKF
ncbi:hypothetical protein LRAMOSA09770 [Lichtheimia ramosa]|uniref:Yeast cell wall synthesis Kre9/Knh1-like N-terminal domain-containing protein n=1 Tax=Lichtheimia ramosa TaxID=688394 RepID=A0A077WNU1_9FUNG|nr:hypothetical protein LRAMOSA09770 [Lichtheimia ramosa]